MKVGQNLLVLFIQFCDVFKTSRKHFQEDSFKISQKSKGVEEKERIRDNQRKEKGPKRVAKETAIWKEYKGMKQARHNEKSNLKRKVCPVPSYKPYLNKSKYMA